jgi:Domain of unknown function (DUF4062)
VAGDGSKKTVYISSTFEDLEECRSMVNDALRRMGYEVLCMEDYLAKDQRTVDRCLADISTCDFFVGIYAKRYGWIPPGETRSITELEYRAARRHNRTCLLFLLDKGANWPLKYVDSETGDGDGGTLVRQLRSELEPLSPSLFVDREDLVRKVMQSVHLAEAAMPVSTIALPNELKDQEPLLLISSSKEEIEQKVRVVNEAENAVSIVVDLDTTWWNTRLHLLAALATDCTAIRQFIFLRGGQFVGIASPSAVRGKLCARFVDVEIAYLRASASLPTGYEHAGPIEHIVRSFREEMAKVPGGEEHIVTVITAPVLRDILGSELRSESLEVDGPALTPALIQAIITRESPFVPLTKGKKLVQLVDRLALASSIARAFVANTLDK